MADGISGRGAYWLGAVAGLVFSAALAAALSVWAPLDPPMMQDVAVAPSAASEAAAAPEQGPRPDPAPEGPAAPGAAPPPALATAPSGEAASPPAAEPEPSASPVSPMETPDAPAAASAPDVATVERPAPLPAGGDGALSQVGEAPPPGAPNAPGEGPASAAATDVAPEASAEPAAEPVAEIGAAVDRQADEGPGPPAAPPGLAANRAPFDAPAEAPILAILLSELDAGMLEQAQQLSHPVAVLAGAGPGGATLAAAARAAGLEAVATGWASGAEPGPVIALAFGEPAQDRAALFARLAAEDLAFVDLVTAGGSSDFRAAQAAGLPAAPLGVRIDDIANSEIVYQALERAALEARKRGAVVAYGGASPAVMAGLRRWMSVKAGRTIIVAPLSAVIDRLTPR